MKQAGIGWRRAAGFLLLLLLGCQAASRSPSSAPDEPLPPPTFPGEYLHSQVADDWAVRALPPASAGMLLEHPRQLYFPPWHAEGQQWNASALSWSLLRAKEGLRPFHPASPLESVAAIQAWLRGENDRASTVWILDVDTDPVGELRGELHLISAGQSWSSGPLPLPLMELETRYPFSAVDLQPVAVLPVSEAEGIHNEEGRLYLEEKSGRRRIEYRSRELRLGPLVEWEELDLSWLERPASCLQRPLPVLGQWSGRARMEWQWEPLPCGEGEIGRFWLRRGGGALPLPLEYRSEESLLALVAAPGAWMDSMPLWVLLRSGKSGRRLELYGSRLRIMSRPDQPRDLHGNKSEMSLIRLQGRLPGLHAPAQDVWKNWLRLHTRVPLALWDIASRTPIPQPGVNWTMEDGGKVWKLELPCPGPSQGLPAITPEDWLRAWRRKMAHVKEEAPGWGWLVDGITVGEAKKTSDGIRLGFSVPITDLPERLCHPALALEDEVLERRFASHERSRSDLLPRQRSGCRIQLDPATSTVEQIAYLGQHQLIRLQSSQLATALNHFEISSRKSWAEGDDSPWVYRREEPAAVALICNPVAPLELRKKLARVLLQLTPYELLALEDSALAPRGVISGRPLRLSSPAVGEDAGQFALIIVDDPRGSLLRDRERVLDRLEVLLAQDGIHLLRESGRGDGSARIQDWPEDFRVYARLAVLRLFSGESLLRAWELGKQHLGLGINESERRWMPGDPQRDQLALDIEQSALDDGLCIPLWTEAGVVLIDRRVRNVGPILPGLPPLLREIRWWDEGGDRSP